MDSLSRDLVKRVNYDRRFMFIPLDFNRYSQYKMSGYLIPDDDNFIRAYYDIDEWSTIINDRPDEKFVLMVPKFNLLNIGFFEVKIVDKSLDEVTVYEKAEDDLEELRHVGGVDIEVEYYFVLGKPLRKERNRIRVIRGD